MGEAVSITTFLDYAPNRGVLWLSLTDQARVLHHGTLTDGGGGRTDHYQLLGTAGTYVPGGTVLYSEAQLSAYSWTKTRNIPCRIDALGGEEGETAERVSDRSTHIVTMAAGTVVFSINDDIQIENRGRYEVTAIPEHTGQMAQQLEVTDRI